MGFFPLPCPCTMSRKPTADSKCLQALSFMLQNLGKPVILTGSQAPMLELQNDAEGNLLNSLILAGHFMIPEVCLFFNTSLFRGNRTTKVSASDFAAFASPNLPPLATISSQKTHVSAPARVHYLLIRLLPTPKTRLLAQLG